MVHYKNNSIIILFFMIVLTFINNLIAQVFDDESWKWYNDAEVAIVEITIDPVSLAWVYDQNNWHSDSLHLCSVHFKNAVIDETIDSVGFRLRGNTSRDSQKKSFKLSFNTFIPGRQIYNIEKLNLNGEHNDPSIIRSKICWDLYQSIGMKASRAAHAAVYINGDYYGLYISVEHIDEEFLENHFTDSSGNLWKCLYPADLTYRGDNPADYYPFFDETRPYELKTNEDVFDYGPLLHFIDIINNTPNESFEDSLETILNIPEFLKYLAVDVITGSWDDYWALMNNYYLYYEPAEGIFHWIPYDYDNTFSVDWKGIDWATADPYEFPRFVDGDRPLADRVIRNNRYRNLYTHFIEFYTEKIFNLPLWESNLDNLKNSITPWAETDQYRTMDYGFTIEDFHNSYTKGEYSNAHVKRGLKNFIDARIASLRNQLDYVESGPIIYEINYWPIHPLPTDSIRVTVSAFSAEVLSSVDIQISRGNLTELEVIPMQYAPLNDTKRIEYADRWTGTIGPIEQNTFIQFQVKATDKKGQTQVYPRTKGILLKPGVSETGSLFINEFLAKNSNTNSDNNGEYEDWLEVYNPGQSAINMSGMYLSDDPDNLTRWQFPDEGSEILPNGFLLVWCDNDNDPTELHSNFKLDGDGEFIALTASDGVTVIDSLSFGAQGEDISFGRSPNGSPVWTSMNPTPGSSNNATGILKEIYPEDFTILIFPNPFNPETSILYKLPEAGKVNMSIYNTLGQKVTTLVNDYKVAGSHKVNWNGKNKEQVLLGSGLYFCRLQAGERELVKRIMFIR